MRNTLSIPFISPPFLSFFPPPACFPLFSASPLTLVVISFCGVNFLDVNKRRPAAESSRINQKLLSYRDQSNINVAKSRNLAAILTNHNVRQRKPH